MPSTGARKPKIVGLYLNGGDGRPYRVPGWHEPDGHHTALKSLAKVALPAGLTTNFGKKLSYKTGLSASAEILTDETRLLEKLFYNLRKITGARQ